MISFYLLQMSTEDFGLLDDTSNNTSTIKRDFMKIYHQEKAQINDSNQAVDSLFGKNNNQHQIGKVCLEFDMSHR